MSEQQGHGEQAPSETAGRLQRRGLMAALAALVGAGVAKLLGAERVQAGHDMATAYNAGQVMHLAERNDGGNPNNDDVTTNILNETALIAFVGSAAALRVRNVHPAGSALRADGGNSRIDFPTEDGGLGIIAQGGSSAQNRGGEGMAGIGGSGGRIGGVGVLGRGGFTGSGTGGVGVEGTGGPGSVASGWGVWGRGGGAGDGAGAEGVVGETRSPSNAGVRGRNFGSGPGVLGQSGEVGTGSGVGVLGQSGTGIGVQGTTGGLFGIRGTTTSTNLSSYGVFGEATRGGTGVAGRADGNNFGVYGFAGAAGGYGVKGESPNNIGVFATSANGYALYATGGTAASSYAGLFVGKVQVQGAFTVVGGPKSAAVPHPDGSYRRMYCMEGTESWFEDVGRGQLASGRAQVALDPDFAAVVQSDAYEVFPVPKGDCKGLYVSTQSPTGFEVRELQGGTSSIPFSYRVIAKRKDIPGPRMERLDLERDRQTGRVQPRGHREPPPTHQHLEPPPPPPTPPEVPGQPRPR